MLLECQSYESNKQKRIKDNRPTFSSWQEGGRLPCVAREEQISWTRVVTSSYAAQG